MALSTVAAAPAPTIMPTEAPICEGGHGLFLPFPGSTEHELPKGLMVVAYLVGMLWVFMGVGIIADIFMGAIEVITSKEVEVKAKDGTTVTVKVWNATVANLTLMALGSSAPEIILSVLEITANNFYSGDLGPSTIVGSAAFNLLMITAVCVSCFEDGEGRKIVDMNVFTVTASFSIWAYVWLIVVLVMPPTPDVCSFYEGLLTFLFFPLVVELAYLADRGYFSSQKVAPASHVVDSGGDYKTAEAAEALKKLDGLNLTNEEKARLMVSITPSSKPSRAALRMQATRMMSGGRRVVAPPPSSKLLDEFQKRGSKNPQFFFADHEGQQTSKYAILESNPILAVHVMRFPATGSATIKFKTVELPGGAKAGEDFEATEGVLEFADGETTKDINVKVMDDEAVEDDEAFQVHIYDCSMQGAELADGGIAEITIVDDDEPGEIGFDKDVAELVLKESTGKYMLRVKRFNGSNGTLTVKYKTDCEKLKTMPEGDARLAQPGLDFESTEGVLEFGPGEIEKLVPIVVLDDKMPEPKTVKFDVVLFDCVGPSDRACLTDTIISQITIVNDENTQAIMDLAKKLQAEMDEKYSPETSSWSQQFADAMTIEEEEDGSPPGHMTIVLHYITLPWKLVFATCPPTSYGGGWVCFCVALIMIGCVTGFIGDLAELFGCSLGIPDQITAITFVALGTSLPDTFASKAAAVGDDSADAAIGNVTGSNAVNVFLGLGLPWLMAGAYWDLGTHSDEEVELWNSKYAEMPGYLSELAKDGKVAFAVPAGSLGPSVTIFVCCAIACLALLYYRRVTCGMELGGPKSSANLHAGIMVGLWLVYIIGSILVQ